MAFLTQKPEMPFARLAASFWHGRQFLGAEEGKEKAKGRQGVPSAMSYQLSFGADGIFGAKTRNAICASFGVILTWASISWSGGRQGYHKRPCATSQLLSFGADDVFGAKTGTAARHANGISSFCAKNAIGAKRQLFGRRRCFHMILLPSSTL